MKWQRRSLAYWKQRIFYVISFFLIAGVFFAFGKDAAIIVTGILIGLNICLGRKTVV